jgi:hypothetical protein
MDVGSFSGSAGGCRGWFQHRPSHMHPVPMALWRSQYPVRFQQFFEAYVGHADCAASSRMGADQANPIRSSSVTP